MTPAARYAAAIDILDRIRSGEFAERSILLWSRQNRYAGSKDRAAIRDHVFDILRKRRSCEARGGGTTGRQLVLGHLRLSGEPEDAVFSLERYAPEPLTDQERSSGRMPEVGAEASDLPEWIWEDWRAALGQNAHDAAQSQRERGKVFLRVNTSKVTQAEAATALRCESISTDDHPTVSGCLIVKENARGLRNSSAYLDGLVEIQDASSQHAVSKWPIEDGDRILDFCAGGGGKSLAMAAIGNVKIKAHDISEKRMKDLPIRADRAAASIAVITTDQLSDQKPFDIVVCDAPCSGSGTWRRNPDFKWRLSNEDVENFHEQQLDVLNTAKDLVKDKGLLIFATCSILRRENEDTVLDFVSRNGSWKVIDQLLQVPSELNDGFYHCVLKNN